MQLSSYGFIFLFLPAIFFGYFLFATKSKALARDLYLISSIIFYYCNGKAESLAIFSATILLNYGIGKLIRKLSLSKSETFASRILAAGVATNIGFLVYYKYTGFFASNFDLFFPGTGAYFPDVVMPIGISFFTFQQIAWLVDIKNGKAEIYSILDYALFISFFQHILSGPIVRHIDIMPQLINDELKWTNHENIAKGLFLLSIGLFKKIIIADSFSPFVGDFFDGFTNPGLIGGWAASLSYSLQLYFDFSGYTDIALGSALIMNIRLPLNFNSPYKARDIQDFWRRWHITLSSFWRDYLYIPLGGNRKGDLRTSVNLFITFLIGGLWHGASWMFILWGAFHGIAVAFHRIWKKTGKRLPVFTSWLYTFIFVNFCWVFFRAKDIASALKILKAMTGFSGLITGGKTFISDMKVPEIMKAVENDFWLLVVCIFFIAITAFSPNSMEITEKMKPDKKTAIIAAVLFSISAFGLSRIREFVYVNF